MSFFLSFRSPLEEAAEAPGAAAAREELEEEELDPRGTSAPCSLSATKKAAAPTALGRCVRQSLVRRESVRTFHAVCAKVFAPGPPPLVAAAAAVGEEEELEGEE